MYLNQVKDHVKDHVNHIKEEWQIVAFLRFADIGNWAICTSL
jgi:hypothetical protein